MKHTFKGSFLSGLTLIIIVNLAFAVKATTVTEFNVADPSLDLQYPLGGEIHNFSITVPKENIIDARMRLEGLSLTGLGKADVILVTDVSGSMDDDCPGGSADPGETPCKINDAKTAALSFLDNVNLSIVQVGLTDYSTDAHLSLQLSRNKTALENTINSYAAGGWTNMGGGMELGIDELLSVRAQPDSSKYMLVLTDGIANCGSDPTSPPALCGSSYEDLGTNYSLDMAARAADNNIVIFGIGFGSEANMDLIRNISTITGGQWYFAPDAATLKDIYDEIAASLVSLSFPTPVLTTTSPLALSGWETNSQFNESVLWNNSDCGSASATCNDFSQVLQQNVDACLIDPCTIQFSVSSATPGQLILSELYIETQLCGNNIIEVGESCDDGNNADGDGCNAICDVEFCGDNIVNNINETCDDGNNDNLDACRNDCTLPFCGDGIQDPDEDCDDGNINNNDTCTDSCTLTVCGDGIAQDPNGDGLSEACDDGNNNNNDTCTNECALTYCGDAIVQSPNGAGVGGPLNDGNEECDHGLSGSEQCTTSCTLTFCGDGIVQHPNGVGKGGPFNDGFEACDSSPDCDANCESTIPGFCGDGTISIGEVCDDGNNLDGDGCSALCIIEFCGDGIVNNVNETCDDGNTNSGDGCDGTCNFEPDHIQCEDLTPIYLINIGDMLTINLEEIFDFFGSPGTVVNMDEISSSSLIITPDLPDNIIVETTGLTSEQTAQIQVETDSGIFSPYCPVKFFGFNSQCEKTECDVCFPNPTFSCLESNGCFDKQILVLNPHTPIKPILLYPDLPVSAYVSSFRSLPGDGFIISPASGDVTDIYILDGQTNSVPDGTESAAVMEVLVGSGTARICPKLLRLNLDIGENSYDPETDLLITESRAIIGYYEESGFVYSTGPYIFTAKVWLRE